MGSIKDVANLAIFLTNDQSNYITGQSFVIVDGGLSLISQEAIANFLKKKINIQILFYCAKIKNSCFNNIV